MFSVVSVRQWVFLQEMWSLPTMHWTSLYRQTLGPTPPTTDMEPALNIFKLVYHKVRTVDKLAARILITSNHRQIGVNIIALLNRF